MKNKNMKKKIVIITLVLALIGTATWFVLAKTDLIRNNTNSPKTTSDEEPVSYDPPTEEEQAAGNEQKESIPSEEPTAPNNATVVIADANQYDSEIEVRAFVSNHVEDGKCKLRFTQGSRTVEKNVSASADAQSTPCMNTTFLASELGSKGTWQVEVSYTSASGSISGKATKSFEVK